jgi:hypothetical protein
MTKTFSGLVAVGEIDHLPTRLSLQAIEEFLESLDLSKETVVRRSHTIACASTLDKTYDTTTTGYSQTFTSGDTRGGLNYSWMTWLGYVTKTDTPTSLEVKIQLSDDGTNWYDPTGADYEVTIVAADMDGRFYLTAPFTAPYMRVYATAVGTDGTHKITVDSSVVLGE